MTAKELTDVLGAIADHFASNDANIRERDFGVKLRSLLAGAEPEPEPEPEVPVTEG